MPCSITAFINQIIYWNSTAWLLYSVTCAANILRWHGYSNHFVTVCVYVCMLAWWNETLIRMVIVMSFSGCTYMIGRGMTWNLAQ